MQVGDTLKTKKGDLLVVENKTLIATFVEVFNLEIEGNENYYVTEDGLLVHNGYNNKATRNEDGSYDLDLSYKDGWSEAQKAAADEKIAALNETEMKVSEVQRGTTSAAETFRNAGNTIPDGCDIDHTKDLQLGGIDDITNMNPLDSSVNRSLGSQINHLIKDMDIGTIINHITIK